MNNAVNPKIKQLIEIIYNVDFDILHALSILENLFSTQLNFTDAKKQLDIEFKVPQFTSQFINFLKRKEITEKDKNGMIDLIFNYLV